MADELQAAAGAPPIASELVRALFVLLKAASVYDRRNEGYRRHSEAARAVLARALEEQGGVELECRGDLLFFNKQRVRVELENAVGTRFVRDEMARRGVGAVEVARGCGPEELDALVFSFRAVEPRKGEGFRELSERLRDAGAPNVALKPRAATEDRAGEDAADGRRLAQKAFFQAMRVVEDAMTRARAGQDVAFAPAKRAVHGLVDRVIEDEQALFELSTIRSFDEYTYAHCVNVCVYSISLGVRLGLDRAQLSELGFAALFHDLGKICLPLGLINKPDELDESDWAQMRRHPVHGAKALLAARRGFDRGLARSVAVAFEHHLGFDGSGYPRLRAPRRQDLFTRICAVADAFDAMTSGRVYQRKPMSPAEALRRMLQKAGKGWDRFLLRLFVGAVGVFPIGTAVLLDTGELGVVCRNDPANPLRPRVRVRAGGGATGAKVVDLGALDAATGRPLRAIARIAFS